MLLDQIANLGVPKVWTVFTFSAEKGSFHTYLTFLMVHMLSTYIEEKTYHWKYFRSFSVAIEGDTVVQNIDIYSLVGRKYAVPLRFLAECNDDFINVDFISDTCEATLSAISVRRIYPDSEAPDPIQEFHTIGGYSMNILYWDYVVANDLAGYRIYRRQPGETWQLLTTDPHPLYRYFDYDVEVGVEYEYAVTTEDLWGNESNLSDSLTATALPFEATDLPRYIMDITEENLYLLNIDVYSSDPVDADLTLEGESFPGSGVHYRGGYSRPQYKKNYKLELPTQQTHDNRDEFNLQSNGLYPSILNTRLGYQSYDLLDLPNPQSMNIHLQLNNEYIGVYTDLEDVDNHFLERVGWSPVGDLYEAFSDLTLLPSIEDYQYYYPNITNENDDYSDLIDFIEWLNNATPDEFRQEVGGKCDLDRYIDIYTVRIATADNDFGYHNYYIYHNPADDRWYFVSWDHDMTFNIDRVYSPIDLGTAANPIIGASGEDRWNILLNTALEDDLFRYAYCKKLARFLNDGFSIQNTINRIELAQQEIYEDAIRDMYKKGRERPDLFINSLDTLCAFAQQRVPFLLNEIETYITDPELAPYFRLNEIQSVNSSTIADEAGDYDPWVEIVNLAPVELDLEDFVLHHGQESWTLPAEAVIDDYGFLLIWLDGETGEGPFHASFSLAPGEGSLWLEGRHGGMADSVTFPILLEDQVWAREVDGTGPWSNELNPTPGSTNAPLPDPSVLVINEFLADNETVNPDEFGDFDDWVEIYNPTADTIPIGGVYLTDDLTRPTRWAFPDTFMAPGAFLLVWCDDEPLEGSLHTVFKISADGEQLGLFDRDGATPIDTITFGEQLEDYSYGRWPDGSEDWYTCNPSPGDANVGVPKQSADSSIPEYYSLEPNFPNPFNPYTEIRFGLPAPAQVRLTIYNLCGQRVTRLIDQRMNAGYHSIHFDAAALSSGIYFYRIEADGFVSTRKMLLLK